MTHPTRVFHLIKSLGRGGAEMLLPETLRHADRDRFEYRYGYFLPWKDAMAGDLRAMNVDVECFNASNNVSILFGAKRLAQQLREWKADLLHCHLPIAGVVGRIAGRMASVPVVYTEHNLLERYHPVTRRMNLASWKWQERVIAVSGDVASSLRRSAPEEVQVDVVLNGVDVDRFDPASVDAGALRRRIGIPLDAPVVGTVAVFRTQKQLHHWLEAAHLLRDRHPDCRFLLVGDGPLRKELEAKAASLGLNDAVHWAGLQDDVRPYLAAMEVYLMSSLFEGLPIALLEAMSMRCAVVSTDVGGIPELVEEGRSGFLVEAGRPDRLAEATSGLLGSPELLDRFGRTARETVETRFSIQRMSRELEAMYADVISGYRNGR